MDVTESDAMREMCQDASEDYTDPSTLAMKQTHSSSFQDLGKTQKRTLYESLYFF